MFRAITFTFFLLSSPLSLALSYNLEITEDELQEKVDAMMPLEKNKLFITVILSDPDINLIEGENKIGIFSNIKVLTPVGSGTGKTYITGTLSYEPEKGAFFYKDPKIKDLEIDKIPKEYIPKVKKIAQKLAKKILKKKPVYKLKDDTLKQKLANSMLKSVSVKDKTLLLELSVF
jgi:hypothetical protein